eukprot:gnl/TRDRNA2_/TRDRNA2_39378_c1_seq1.p1 gnl/TRDRNA2_/TRDRNA2_39378_c1~~gnl/TRDRNA2_/TRDRNA2_39378_c1_seq1.p1  ORF type:complete len:208 (+),score=68.98 gnl/TRDRNA2_/TRDRNA2_39378_c1_seq1:78-701(+)
MRTFVLFAAFAAAACEDCIANSDGDCITVPADTAAEEGPKLLQMKRTKVQGGQHEELSQDVETNTKAVEQKNEQLASQLDAQIATLMERIEKTEAALGEEHGDHATELENIRIALLEVQDEKDTLLDVHDDPEEDTDPDELHTVDEEDDETDDGHDEEQGNETEGSDNATAEALSNQESFSGKAPGEEGSYLGDLVKKLEDELVSLR